MGKVISYDFDGCLHRTVDDFYNPLDFMDIDSWEPFEEIHRQLREDAREHHIIVVTARPSITDSLIREFMERHRLPFLEIFATEGMPKAPILRRMGAVRHYDDNPKYRKELEEAGIELVLVDPFSGKITPQFKVGGE